MDNWSLPISVEIDEKEYKIRNKCDYRVVLDVIDVFNDDELNDEQKAQCALFIFYEDLCGLTDYQTAMSEMMKIINCGDEPDTKKDEKPKIMDWKHDYNNITPPISRVLGYSVRDSKNYTHWYDFVGAYMEIGDCYFAQVISVRTKILKGKKLEESDRKFYKEHKQDVDLPMKLSDEEQMWLESEF